MQTGVMPIEILSREEFAEAWEWLVNYITINQELIEEHGYFFDHKHWQYPECVRCIDQCEKADLFLARLYIISQLAQVSDYLDSLKYGANDFVLRNYSEQLDADVARVINAKETANNLNSFRNSLSEHLIYWTVLATIIKTNEGNNFSIAKPNLQPEDKGPDGLVFIFKDEHTTVKIISIKNSIASPKDLISSSKFRRNGEVEPNCKKILDEFYVFRTQRGFQRLDEKLNHLLQELHQDAEIQFRCLLLLHHSQFNAAVVANEEHASRDLFIGFNKIVDEPNRCVGIFVGSENWKDFAADVQVKVKEILREKGVSL